VAVRDFPADRFVVLASRRGFVKKTPLAAFGRPTKAGIIAVSLDEGDGVLAAGISDGECEIFMGTTSGKSIRFRESDVRPMGRNARGVIGIRMAPADQLVEMEVLSGKPDILSMTSKGYGKRTAVQEYRLQGRGGSGIINMRTTARNGRVVAVTEVSDEYQTLLITAQGKIIRMDASGISRIGRATQGVRLIQMEEGDVVVAAIRTAEREEEGTQAPVATSPDPDDVLGIEGVEDDAPGD
jgi:DNA gyrase subunit A